MHDLWSYLLNVFGLFMLLIYSHDFSSFQEIRRRGLKVAVAGIPKTIDNDIPVLLLLCSTSGVLSFTSLHFMVQN